MRRWIGWAARCFPGAWRSRYGDEFAALLEDAEPHWRDVWDVLREAVSMHMKTPATYVKFGVATALAGAIAAGGWSLATPKRYVSTAVLRPARPLDSEAARHYLRAQQDVLSRGSLAEIIQRPALDLYRDDRTRLPMEDVLDSMRDRDLKIEPAGQQVRVTFAYDDPVKAQAVVKDLSTRLGGGVLEVVTPASLPDGPVRPDWVRMIGIGLAAGLILGLLLAFLRGRTVRWILKVTGCGLAGGLAAISVCMLAAETLLNEQRVFQLTALGVAFGVTLGVYLLRQRTARGGYAAQIAFCALSCSVLGALVSFVAGEEYISSATLRIYPFTGSDGAAVERLREIAEEALSRNSLIELIQKPSIDLYRKERQRYPMEDILERMRARDLKIEPATDRGLATVGEAAFRISFRYPDRDKAQAVTREMTTRFTEKNARIEHKLHPEDGQAGLVAEIIDPATLPPESVSPNRAIYAGVGLTFGAMLGALLGWRRWRAESPAPADAARPPYLRYALLTGAAGVVIAALGSFVIAERYVSTAVLRVAAPPGQDAAVRVRQLIAQVTARDTLATVMGARGLNLYDSERQRRPMEQVLEHMRHDLHAEPLSEPLGKEIGRSRTAALRISFEYADAQKAQECVRQVVNSLVERRGLGPMPPELVPAAPAAPTVRVPSAKPVDLLGGVAVLLTPSRDSGLFARTTSVGEERAEDVSLEVLDAASRPESPASPNRTTIGLAGGVAGLMFGLMLARRRA